MATEIKKYLDMQSLGTLVDQIKNEDAKVLAAAKKYTDDAGALYDVAGSAATVQANLDAEIARAKAAEKVNADAIAAIKDGEVVDSFKDVETELAKYQLSGDYATKEEAQNFANAKDEAIAEAKKAGDDAQADLDGFKVTVAETYETKVDAAAKLTEAKGYTDTKVAEVDAKVTENTGDIEELAGKVAVLEASGYDDTEVRGLISDNAEAIEALEGTHATDKEALESAIALKADKTALDEEVERAKAAEKANADEIARVNNVLVNALENDGEGLDSIKELATWINTHGQEAAEMTGAISQNAEDIEALEGRVDAAEDALETVDTRIAQAITDANLSQYAKDTDLDAAVERVAALELADAAQDELLAGLRTDVDAKATQADFEVVAGKVTVVEGKVETLEGKVDVEKVSTAIATAKQEAIDAAAIDAANKDVVVLAEAQQYTDAEIDKVEEKVAELESASGTHALKTEVEAVAGKVTTLEGEMAQAKLDIDAVEALVAANQAAIQANQEAIALKASQADLNAAVERIAANETAIAANTSAINSFTPVTSDEVNALFA